MAELSDEQYHVLLIFRTALRHYLRWSGEQARELGLTAQQHQLLLAVRGHPGPGAPSIAEVTGYLLTRHNSTVELVSRVERLGLLRRSADADDQRVVRLYLTDRGASLIDQLTAAHMAELQRVADGLHITEEFLGSLSAEFVHRLPLAAHGPDTTG